MWRGGQCVGKPAIIQHYPGGGRRRFFSSFGNKEKSRLFGSIKSTHVAGVGALVMTLATQNIAQELAGGLSIKIEKEVSVGDEAKLGDGTAGIVFSIGWISSSIRGYVFVMSLFCLHSFIDFPRLTLVPSLVYI